MCYLSPKPCSARPPKAGEVCYPVDRQPSTVYRQTHPQSLCDSSPNLEEQFSLSTFSAISALKQTSLVLRTISPNLGENDFSSPTTGEDGRGGRNCARRPRRAGGAPRAEGFVKAGKGKKEQKEKLGRLMRLGIERAPTLPKLSKFLNLPKLPGIKKDTRTKNEERHNIAPHYLLITLY